MIAVHDEFTYFVFFNKVLQYVHHGNIQFLLIALDSVFDRKFYSVFDSKFYSEFDWNKVHTSSFFLNS